MSNLNITPVRRELLMTALHIVRTDNYDKMGAADHRECDTMYVELSAMPAPMPRDPVNPPQIDLPSLEALNDLTHARKALLMLRLLMTSDMATWYMVLGKDTVDDLCNSCTRTIDDEVENGPAPYMKALPLSFDEVQEAGNYMIEMGRYTASK